MQRAVRMFPQLLYIAPTCFGGCRNAVIKELQTRCGGRLSPLRDDTQVAARLRISSTPMHPLVAGCAGAAAASLVLTPAVIRLAHARAWIAKPRADRWSQHPTALMGGIA